MAINAQSLLYQFSPMRGLDLSGLGQASAERERMRLMRERLEEEKRWHDQQAEYQKMAEAGATARKQLDAQMQREKAQAAQDAALLGKQQEGLQKFGELAGAGKVQAAEAMIPYLDQLGYSVENLGQTGGLPVYRLTNRAQEAARAQQEPQSAAPAAGNEAPLQSLDRMQALGLGYPTDERGVMTEPAGIGSTEDAFTQAQAASQYATDNGKPMRGPDAEDFMGAVPRNVIDLPAMQRQTLERLGPTLGGLTRAYDAAGPDYRKSADATAMALANSGLDVADAANEFAKLRSGPDSAINAQTMANAQKERFRETRDALTETQKAGLRKNGEASANRLFQNTEAKPLAKALESADTIERILDDKSRANDSMIAGLLMDFQDVKGTPSNTDLAYALGMKTASTWDQIRDWIQTHWAGGFGDVQREAIRAYIAEMRKSQRGRMYDYLNQASQMSEDMASPYEREGFDRVWRNSVPARYYNDWLDEREKAGGPSREARASGDAAPPGADGGDLRDEVMLQAADSGLDPEPILAIIGGESGGKTTAKNPGSSARGLVQFTDATARDYGFENAAEFAKLPMREQVGYAMQLFRDRGLDENSRPEDYALAVAAPKFIGSSPDTVVYPKGSNQWNANAPWRPADGGDITVRSITDYYRQRGLGGGGASQQGAPNEGPALPPPSTPAEERLRQLMQGGN